jgi:hypothetical protein
MQMLALLLALAFPAAALAQAAKPDPKAEERRKAEIAQHRTLAEAHEKAARCLEAGKEEKECHAQLAKDCKGMGIGKHCGMKHKH